MPLVFPFYSCGNWSMANWVEEISNWNKIWYCISKEYSLIMLRTNQFGLKGQKNESVEQAMFELHFDIKVEILQGTVNFPEGENTGWPRIVFLFMSSHFGGKEQKPAEASSNGGKFIWKKKKKKQNSQWR